MYAAFLVEIESSCHGITGDATIATVLRKSGLALPGGRCVDDETPKKTLCQIIERETAHITDGLELVYEGLVHEHKIGAFVAKTLKHPTPYDTKLDHMKYDTIDNLLISQADLQIRRWLVEAILSCGLRLDTLSMQSWVSCFGSGTLQYSVAAGSSVKSKNLYLHERCAFELQGAECITSSRVAFGPPLAEGDCPKWTESLWNVRKLRATWPLMRKIGPVAPQYITISEDNRRWEGYGVVLQPSIADFAWWPAGYSAVIKF